MAIGVQSSQKQGNGRRTLKIAILGPINHPISEPFQGGLEAHTWQLTKKLIERGHDVTLYASANSDPTLPLVPIIDRHLFESPRHRGADGSSIAAKIYRFLRNVETDQAYTRATRHIQSQSYDIIHNNAISQKALEDSYKYGAPVVCSLHTSIFREMYHGVSAAAKNKQCHFVAVSEFVHNQWSRLTPSHIIHNGIDMAEWPFSAAAIPDTAIWFGRIHPSKSPHLAMEAALKAGVKLDLYGGIEDQDYFDQVITPLLEKPGMAYHGLVDHKTLARKIGDASVMLHTPKLEEAFGYTYIESLACGTPVVTYARGAATEILDETSGIAVQSEDTDTVAQAIADAFLLSRAKCRDRALLFSMDSMVNAYESLYRMYS